MFNILIWAIIFISTYTTIYYLADYIIDSVVEISKHYIIAPIIMGVLILGIDLEESIVSVIAAIDGMGYIAIGNIIGNSIIAIGISFGIPALIICFNSGKIPIIYYLALFIAIISILLSMIFPKYFIFFGILNLFIFLVYLLKSISIQKHYYINMESRNKKEKKGYLIFKLLILLILLFASGKLFLQSSIHIIEYFRISETFFGLIITAFLTNVEEFWLIIKSMKKGYPEIGVSAELGKILWNITLVYGISAVVLRNFIYSQIFVTSAIILVIMGSVLIIMLYVNKINKLTGIFFIIALISFVGLNFVVI